MQFIKLSIARERCPECGSNLLDSSSDEDTDYEHPIEISSDDEILELTKDEEYPDLE